MEAKEKAKELIWYFSLEVDNIFIAERCALIAVKEIIKSYIFINPDMNDLIINEEIKFYKEVLEILK